MLNRCPNETSFRSFVLGQLLSTLGTLQQVLRQTGQPPSIAAVREGFSLQLGLLGLIAVAAGAVEESA